MDLPVTVIGGYLGAGKTTLINHLLRHNEGLRLAVLVNEFGELAIDADLIEAEEDGLVSISGGCVCCAFGGDLLGALEDMLAMRPRPDHVLIEASGVAMPAAIATTVRLVDGLRADGVLVLADAEQLRSNAANPYLADTIERQLEQADIVLLTKCDLVEAATRQSVAAWISRQAPSARIVPIEHGAAPVAAVLGAVPFPSRRRAGSHGAGTGFSSAVIAREAVADAQGLAARLADDPGITRAKGFVRTGNGTVLIHVVGKRYTVEPAPGEPQAIGIVCIGPKGVFDPARLGPIAAADLTDRAPAGGR